MNLIKVSDQTNLVETSLYPFASFSFEKFNPVQSRLFEFYSENCNTLVASTTASGKTVCAEMFMAETVRKTGKKALFLAPMKALSQEKYDEWTSKDHHFSNLKIVICTGDYRLTASRKKEIDSADILIMTSEMLNSCSRNYNSDKNEFLDGIGVVVCDEAHSICMTDRGSHIESGLMKFTEHNKHAKLVLLSATLPNVAEVGGWLSSLNGKKTYVLESKFRPTKLNIHFKPYDNSGNYLHVEMNKIREAINILEKHHGDSFLLFVHTKRTGEMLLEELTTRGIQAAFHSADLTKEKRIAVEENFRVGKVRVLVATSTLAWGCCEHGTPILMGDGKTTKPVEEIAVGNEVFSRITGSLDECEPRTVLRIGDKTVDDGLEFKTSAMFSGDNNSVVVSRDHLFYGEINGVKDYFSAEKFKTGDSICRYNHDPHKFDRQSAWRKSNVCFSPICEINIVSRPLVVRDLEVDGSHNYFGNGFLSHNCNLPARRVVILGIHRGLSVVETYDIMQEVGRAGRPKYDPEGDAYILLPAKTFNDDKQRILKQGDIESQLMDPKTLAFHIVSEVHHKGIESHADVKEWFDRSFARYQDNRMDESLSEQVIDRLKKSGSVFERDDGYFDITPVGTISSMFYFSPFDVADLLRNFKNLFEKCNEDDDILLCFALANIDSNKTGITNVAERDEMSKFKKALTEFLTPKQQEFLTDGVCKVAYAYYLCITGANPGVFAAAVRGVKVDFGRLKDVLSALDGMAGRWERSEFFNRLQLRMEYGVGKEMLNLVRIPGIGKVKAERLYNHGLKTLKDVATSLAKVITALNCSRPTAEEVCAEARKLSVILE